MLGGGKIPSQRQSLQGKIVTVTGGPHKNLVAVVISETDSHLILENNIRVSLDSVSTDIPKPEKICIIRAKTLRWVYPGLVVRIINK